MIIKMRRFTKYIVVVFLSLCPFISAFGQKTVSLRVMSMNIRQGGEYAGNKSEPYSELIKKYDPDVVALQEVDYKTTRNGKRDWLNEVAMQTGMFPYFCKSINYQGGDSVLRFFRSIRSSNARRQYFLIRIQERTGQPDGFTYSCLVERP